MASEERPVKKARIEEDSTLISAQQPAGITEADVGITEYISSDPGFTGTLKQRYTDFLVNEIGMDGKVVHLVDLGLADKRDRRRDRREQEREEAKANNSSETDLDQNEKDSQEKPKIQLTEEQTARLVALIGKTTVDEILQLFHTGTKLETQQSFESKDARTQIHQALRECFGGRLESKTTPENKFIITLSTSNSSKRGGSKLDKSSMGPSKNYLHFVMYKENKETMEAANLLSKFLRVPPKTIMYAGTKDRRGVTVQNMCLNKIAVERVNGLNKVLRGIKLGSFCYKDEPIKLGQLNGNEFVITIRDVEVNGADGNVETTTKRCIESLRDVGFINYYGMQRFGTFSISTHEIGKKVLQSDWEQVVNMLLSPQELSLDESRAARAVWKEKRDATEALKLMPKRCIAEHSILRSLAKEQQAGGKYSYANAVMQIPRNLRVMYAHAYQSYVWNSVVSQRIAKHGLNLMAGDLVFDDNTNMLEDQDDDVDEATDGTGTITKHHKARPVTAEELESGSKNIYDVVFPTPGFDVVYPPNEFKDVYEEILKQDSIDINDMRRNIKEFSLAGSYRHIMAKPKNVEVWVRKYEKVSDQLVNTDFELLTQQKGLEDQIRPECEAQISPEAPTKTAVILKMQLGTSQYATMALREAMKLDTCRRGDGMDVKSAPVASNE